MDIEFLDAFDRSGDRTLRPTAECLVVIGIAGSRVRDLATIEQKRVLIAPRSRHLAAETARLQGGCGLLRHCQRLQQKQAGGVALERRQCEDLPGLDGVAHRRVDGLQFGARSTPHLNYLVGGSHLEVHIDRGSLPNLNRHRRYNRPGKAAACHGQRIRSWCDLGKRVLSG